MKNTKIQNIHFIKIHKSKTHYSFVCFLVYVQIEVLGLLKTALDQRHPSWCRRDVSPDSYALWTVCPNSALNEVTRLLRRSEVELTS